MVNMKCCDGSGRGRLGVGGRVRQGLWREIEVAVGGEGGWGWVAEEMNRWVGDKISGSQYWVIGWVRMWKTVGVSLNG